jgi:glycosyltransferase involved in cell wall biosynthesis
MSGTRIGLLCGYLDTRLDGVADYTRRLAAHLRETRFEPLILTTYEKARSAGEGAVGVTERWDVRGVAAATRALRRLDLDLVHVQFAPSVVGFSRVIGLLPIGLPRHVPLVVTLHEYGVWSGHGWPGRARSALWSVAERRGYADRETLLLAPRAAHVLAPSPEHLEVLRTRFPLHASAASEVPIGPNVEVAHVDRPRVRAEVRRELGTGPDAAVVVFFGFLHPEKALDQLIAAVAAQGPATHLLLVGGATSHSVSAAAAARLRRDLEQVAAVCGMHDRVHFTGYVPEPEVSRLLQAADVAAFPFNAGVTRKSGSLLAAFAAGVPVVATAPPGEVPGPTEAGGVLRVPPRDVVALADALGRVLRDRALADRLTAAGRAVAGSQSWDAIAAVHADVYARTLASHRGGESWTGAPEPSRVGPAAAEEGDADVTA